MSPNAPTIYNTWATDYKRQNAKFHVHALHHQGGTQFIYRESLSFDVITQTDPPPTPMYHAKK